MAGVPLKPDRPLASVVFSATGKVSRSIECLPRTQKELETAVVKKFVCALSRSRQINLKVQHAEESQADIHCETGDNSSLGIQITEVVDPLLVRLQEQRRSYSQRLHEYCPELLSHFAGCRLSIIDRGHEPLLPKITSTYGQTAVASLSDRLAEFAESIDDLPEHHRRSIMIDVFDVRLHVVCRRLRSKSESSIYDFVWDGGRCFQPGDQQDFLTATIQKKIKKQYAPTGNPLWLMAYSTDVVRKHDDPDVLTIKHKLATARHPFDMVWYFYPYSEQDHGHLLLLWDAGA